jgi:hypothetical protein
MTKLRNDFMNNCQSRMTERLIGINVFNQRNMLADRSECGDDVKLRSPRDPEGGKQSSDFAEIHPASLLGYPQPDSRIQ